MGRVLSARRYLILAIIIAPVVALHVMHAPKRGPFSNDPSYYMQAARHIANGDGLVSSVSLYHGALEPLPQPYDAYPVWPVLLAIVAKAIGLIAAANVLPQLLFAGDLVLFYVLANRLAGEKGRWQSGGETVDVGHAAALLAGTNYIFFTSTLAPYTEGLAFALAMGSFLLLDRHPAWSGVLGGLVVLTRYQMVLVPVATCAVLLIGVMTRSATVRKLVLYATTSGSICLAWVLYLRTAGIQRAAIPQWQEWVQTGSLGERVGHIVRGLIVAFTPGNDASLFHSFGAAAVVPLLALIWMFRDRKRGVFFWSVAASGVALTIVLANFESVRWPFWLFGSRHSAAYLFAIVAALVALLDAPRAVRAVAAILVVTSIALGTAAAFRDPVPAGRGLTGAERAMADWLNARHPGATLLSTNAQSLSVYTRNKFHWTSCEVPAEKTRLMLDKLTIDYVIVYDAERSCPFASGLEDRLTLDATFRDEMRQIQLFRVTRKISRTGAPSTLHDAAG